MFKNGYLLNSRILTHVIFWVLYYVFFSLIWANAGQYYASFGLEFLLLPIRISASYIVLYSLMPRLLLKGHELRFGLMYLLVIVVGGILQRVFTYFYYELLILETAAEMLTVPSVIKSIVLINTTVLLLSAMKIFKHWKQLREQTGASERQLVEIRAEKRNYRVDSAEIMYVEGLGNHVIFYLTKAKKLISYISLKEAEELLPETFMRSHKSFVINKALVESYTSDSVEIGGRILPVGRSVRLEF